MHNYYNLKKQRKDKQPSVAVIRYDESEQSAPQVVAQGTGATALKILEIAKQNQIHIQEDPSLVSQLMNLDLGSQIPPQLYSVIAEILLLIEEMERRG